MMGAARVSERRLLDLLEARHPASSWAFFRHVRSSTGWGRKVPEEQRHDGRRYEVRTVDALALCLWPSLGMELHGFEVKVSRADWARELRQPGKAEEVARYCDRWWVVAAGPDVVPSDQLPPSWGLLIMAGGTSAPARLEVVVQAGKLEPVPLDRGFVASIARTVAKVRRSAA